MVAIVPRRWRIQLLFVYSLPYFVSWSLRATIGIFHSSHFCRRINVNATLEATAIDAGLLRGGWLASKMLFLILESSQRDVYWIFTKLDYNYVSTPESAPPVEAIVGVLPDRAMLVN